MCHKKTLFFILFLMFPAVLSYAADRAAVSVIFSSDIEPYQQAYLGFKEFLDGNKVALQVSKYNLKEKQPETICSKINEEKPAMVFTLGLDASKLANQNLKNIPVVFCMVFDTEAVSGLNITGVSMDIPVGMKLENIKRILPDVKKIGLIYSTKSNPQYKEISQAAEEFGFQIIARKITSGKEFPDALKEISWQIDCFLMLPDTAIYFPQSVEYLLIEGLKNKFPVVGLSSFYTKTGALISFDCDYSDIGNQAGAIALRLLNGEKPADIGFSRPRKIKTSFNLITAERLNIKIPRVFIKEASDVFEE